MSIRLFAACIIGSAMAAAQQPKPDVPPPEWQYTKNEDLLHAKMRDQFVLEGVYLTPPRVVTQSPAIVVQCSAGKVESNHFNVGAVVDRHGETGLGIPLINGFEVRIDGKK